MEIRVSPDCFNDTFLPYLEDYTKRYEIYYGGAGSGKSHFVAQKLIWKAINEKRKIICLRKVGRTVKTSIFQLLLEQLAYFGLYKSCYINRTDYTIELPNGSIFLCSGLDDSEKIKSIVGITDIWMEEATEFIQDDFNQLDLRLRHPTAEGQTITLSFNPVSKVNWCYKLFFDENPEMLEFREKCTIIKTTYLDNKFLPIEYVNSLLELKRTNIEYYGIYALGNFGSLGKLVYTNWQVADFSRKELKGTTIAGLDWGFTNDTTAFIASVLNEDEKRIYVIDEWGDTGLVNSEIAQKIKDMGYHKTRIIADSAEQKSIEEVKREGVYYIKPSVKGQGSINQGIQKLQQYEIVVNPKCVKTIEELKTYAWKKDKNTNEYINEAEDKNNHFLDALRYSLQCISEGSGIKANSKSLLFG